MNTPKVSIIVPVYNTQKFLNRALDSILAQSEDKLELIIIDDGSTDNSGNICDNYARKDTRIKVIHQNNQGVSAARNQGLDAASGKYIMFADSDDELYPNAIELLINAAMQGEYDMVIGDCKVTGKIEKFSHLTAANKIYTNYSLGIEMMIVPETKWLMSAVWAKLFKNDIINAYHLRFNEKLINGEDGGFIVDYLSHIEHIAHVDQTIYTLYRYEESERVSAVTAFYYDFYAFYMMHSEKLWNITKNHIPKEAEEDYYSRFIDGLITYLVHIAAYQNYFSNKQIILILKDIMNHELVSTAIKSYKRSNPAFSVLIPLFIKSKNSTLLYYALKLRVRQYWKTHTRSKLVKSIYRGKNIDESIHINRNSRL